MSWHLFFSAVDLSLCCLSMCRSRAACCSATRRPTPRPRQRCHSGFNFYPFFSSPSLLSLILSHFHCFFHTHTPIAAARFLLHGRSSHSALPCCAAPAATPLLPLLPHRVVFLCLFLFHHAHLRAPFTLFSFCTVYAAHFKHSPATPSSAHWSARHGSGSRPSSLRMRRSRNFASARPAVCLPPITRIHLWRCTCSNSNSTRFFLIQQLS